MNETNAVVVRLDGQYAWVQASGPGSACGGCASKEGCGTVGLGTVLDDATGKTRKPQLLRLPNTIQARPGDAVVIRAADGLVLKAVWRAYGVPLILAFCGALLAIGLTGSEPAAVAGMLLGLGAGFLLMRRKGLDAAQVEPILSMGFKHTPVIFH
jgi:sigma-E factor negative regulatory protein RseC